MSKCENFIPTVAGHLRKRSGTIYAGDAKETANSVRLIPFIFSATDALVVELGNLYARFWKDGSQVMDPAAPSNPLEIVTPYTGNEVFELDWSQDADTFVLVHKNHQPRLLQRFADDDWVLSLLVPNYGPYLSRGEIVPGVVPTSAQLNVETAIFLQYGGNDPQTDGGVGAYLRDLRLDQTVGAHPTQRFTATFTAREGPLNGSTSVSNIFKANRDIGRLILINCHDKQTPQPANFIDAEFAYPMWGKIIDVGTRGQNIQVEFYDGWWVTTVAAGATVATQMWHVDSFFEESEPSYRVSGPETLEFTAASSSIQRLGGTGNPSFTADGFEIGMTITVAGAGLLNLGNFTITNITTTTQTDDTLIVAEAVLDDFGTTTGTIVGTGNGAFLEKEWPRTVTFFEDRLFLASTNLGPDLIYGSRVGSLVDYDILSASDAPPEDPAAATDPNPQSEVLATSALSIGISGNEVAQIQWIRPSQRNLVVGTTRSIYQVSSVNQNGVFGPTEAISARPTNAIGSTRVGLVNVRDRVFFLLPSEERLFQLGFQLQADGFVASELSLFNSDIYAQGIIDANLQIDPEQIYWAVTRENKLVSLTVDEQQRVFAFAEHEIGASLAGGDATVESVATIPDISEGEDQIWLVVSRTINGSPTRYIEYIGAGFEAGDGDEEQHYVDAGIITGAGVGTITGLDHLEGETVQVLADGGYIGDFTVTAGTVTFDDPGFAYSEAHVGLQYSSEVHTMPIVVRDPQGSSFSKRHRVSHVNTFLVRSVGGEVAGGPSSQLNWRLIKMRTASDPIGQSLTPKTDLFQTLIEASPGRNIIIGLRHNVPFNLELAALGGYFDASSR
jgi:hypothetical protein